MTIPCKDCLVLAACRQRFSKHYGAVNFAIESNCKMILEYVVGNQHVRNGYTKRVNELRELFGMGGINSARAYSTMQSKLLQIERKEQLEKRKKIDENRTN